MEQNPCQFDNINLLIFEEYLFVSDVLSRMLKSFGIRTIHKAKTLLEAQNICEECYSAGEKEIIDFAIVDLLPPKQHGLEFLQWVRHHKKSRIQYMPIIFTTNDSRENIVINSRDSGATEILVKPYTAYNVSNRLISIINKPRAFIRAPNFYGPSRRRRDIPYDGPDRRNNSDKKVRVIYEENVA